MWRAFLFAAILLLSGALGYLGVPLLDNLVNRESLAGEQDPGKLGRPGPFPSTLPATTIWRGSILDFGFESPTYLVIQTKEEWSSLWTRAARDPPVVDFETRTVLVASYGRVPNGGYRIEVVEVTLEGPGAGSVEVSVDQAGPSCAIVQAISHPTHIVSIPKSEAHFTFRTEITVHACT